MNPRDDSGAMAVLVAILTVMLFAMAAVAVEITDMYSRDRAAQTTADLAALAGAQGLPDSCQAFETALDNLNATFAGSPGVRANGIRDANGRQDDELSQAEMSDRDLSNGEIQVLTDFDGATPPPDDNAIWLPTSGCAPGGTGVDTGRFVRVMTPARTVDFAFALGLRPYSTEPIPDSGDVQAVAAAAIRSPTLKDILPTFLPDTCGFGPNYIVTNSPSAGGSDTETPNFTPNGTADVADAPQVVSVTSSRIDGGLVQEITVTLQNLLVDPTGGTSTVFDFHTGRPSDTERFPDGTSPPNSSPGILADTVENVTGTGPFSAEFIITVPTDITGLGGIWWVRAKEPSAPGTNEWTAVEAAETFDVTAQTAPGCGDPSTGNFGLLSVDRSAPSDTLQDNIIFGLEQNFGAIPVPPPTVDTPCSGDGSPAGALLSNQNPLNDPANCVAIDAGRDAGIITRGFITGDAGGGEDGRLDVSNYDTSGLPSSCGAGGSLTWQTPVNPSRPTIVNTSLSCYTSVPLAQLDDPVACDNCLSPEIFEDPRFFFVPVLYSEDRPSPSGYWPIKEFRAAFITNETESGPATCESSSKCNGVEFNTGDQTIFALQTFVFPLSALPEEIAFGAGDGAEFTGVGPREFVLVQ